MSKAKDWVKAEVRYQGVLGRIVTTISAPKYLFFLILVLSQLIGIALTLTVVQWDQSNDCQ